MSKIESKVCDICEYTLLVGAPTIHWSDAIEETVISFKNHPAIQSEAFRGDICARCARSLCDSIVNTVVKMKEQVKLVKSEKL